MEKKEEKRPQEGAALSGILCSLQERDSDILILHYKLKKSIQSISYILSMEESEVGRIIANFAEQFSNIDNLNNVIECLIKMKKRAKANEAEVVESQSSKDQEIAELKRRLKETEIKAEAYLEMIKVAERVFNIPIRKKYGAK